MTGSTHPSRTDRGTMKISQVSSGLVFERQPPDARDCVATGSFVYVARDTPSIAELLRAKSREDLLVLCAQVGVTKNANEPPEALVSFLVPHVEAGAVTLS